MPRHATRVLSSTARFAGGGEYQPSTTRGLGHLPTRHAPKIATSIGYLPSIFYSPLVSIVGTLPTVATGVQTIRQSLSRGCIMAARQQVIRRARTLVAPVLTATWRTRTHHTNALLQLIGHFTYRLEMEDLALTQALTEGRFKMASAGLELISIACATLPAVHTMLGLQLAGAVVGPLTAVVLPLFALHGCLHTAYHAGRLRESFGLWVIDRQIKQAGRTQGTINTKEDTNGCAAAPWLIPRASIFELPSLTPEVLYFACQTFFWGAFALGMVAGSGLFLVGVLTPHLGTFVLLTGVVGTTLFHFGWAGHYGVPEGLEVAPVSVFGSYQERRARQRALDEEVQCIAALRSSLVSALSPEQAKWYTLLWQRLAPLPYVGAASAWRIDRWLRQASSIDGAALLDVLIDLCHRRMTSYRECLSHIDAVVHPARMQLAQSCLWPERQPELTAAAHAALAAAQKHQEEINADIQRHEDFIARVEQARLADEPWQELVQQWADDEDDTSNIQDITQALMTTLVHLPTQAVLSELELLKGVNRLDQGATLRRLASP